jgi:hypothetical protein
VESPAWRLVALLQRARLTVPLAAQGGGKVIEKVFYDLDCLAQIRSGEVCMHSATLEYF